MIAEPPLLTGVRGFFHFKSGCPLDDRPAPHFPLSAKAMILTRGLIRRAAVIWTFNTDVAQTNHLDPQRPLCEDVRSHGNAHSD